MEFFIRKDSLEPVLKMQLIQDGRNDYKKFHRELELFLCDKGASIIHLDLDRGVDHLIKAFK